MATKISKYSRRKVLCLIFLMFCIAFTDPNEKKEILKLKRRFLKDQSQTSTFFAKQAIKRNKIREVYWRKDFSVYLLKLCNSIAVPNDISNMICQGTEEGNSYLHKISPLICLFLMVSSFFLIRFECTLNGTFWIRKYASLTFFPKAHS